MELAVTSTMNHHCSVGPDRGLPVAQEARRSPQLTIAGKTPYRWERNMLHEQIRQILEDKGHDVVSARSTDTVAAAVDRMNERQIGSVVVIDNGKLAGIFTERDILTRVIAAHLDPATTIVADVMSTDLVTISPAATVKDAMVVMSRERCRHLPVVDDTGLLGLVSIGDMTKRVVSLQGERIDDLVQYISGGYRSIAAL